MTITPGRAFSPVTFPSSSVERYSSPVGVPSTTTGIRSPSLPGPVCIQQVSNSRRNTVTGVEGEILGMVKTLMLHYTLLVHALPNPVALASKVHSIWSRAQDEIADAGNIEPWPKSIKVVSQMSLDKRTVLTTKDKWKTLFRTGAVCISYKKTHMRIIQTTQ